MSFPSSNTVTEVQRKRLFVVIVIIIIIIIIITFSVGAEAEEVKQTIIDVGILLNLKSEVGKEQETAIQIAAQNFNSLSKTHGVRFHYADSHGDPLTAAFAAEELIKDKNVKVLIGMETWPEATLVAEIANRAKLPVISFSSPTLTPPLAQRRWPSLIRVGSNGAYQVKCIAEIVSLYDWKRVVVIYEDDGYGGDTGMLTLLFEALQDIGSKIEHHFVLPRVSSMSNPNLVELEEMLKLPTFQSRVFIVLQSSPTTTTNLFRVAKKMGLVDRDSAWIIAEGITGLLDAQVRKDMEGALAIKTYYASNTSSYAIFSKEFQAQYANTKPGIYALRAYDVARIVTQAITMTSNISTNLEVVLQTVLRNYMGLSGEMSFKRGEVVYSPIFRIANVVQGNKYKELDFWRPNIGFSASLAQNSSNNEVGGVVWPGNSSQAPKGWAMPTVATPLRIGVPNSSFPPFSNVTGSRIPYIYGGFCIELFKKVLSRLPYHLPYEFQYVEGTYNHLVELVRNKTLDAVIGDITILAERSVNGEFTQPFMESGVVILSPKLTDNLEWTFIKPFSGKMWAATGGILLYTILVIWFLERSANPEFNGSFRDQIGVATWFAFTSLFSFHGERLYNGLTRVVVIVWLFAVLILVSSYTANLSSILTLQGLKPNVTDIQALRRTNAKVGLNINSFFKEYLVKDLQFNPENLIPMHNESEYLESFRSKRISAALLERPYADVFMNKNCKRFTATTPFYTFAGLGFVSGAYIVTTRLIWLCGDYINMVTMFSLSIRLFIACLGYILIIFTYITKKLVFCGTLSRSQVFQRDSPIARDFTKAILDLLQKGEIKSLKDDLLTPNHDCQDNSTSTQSEGLNVKHFMGVYLISGVTSTLCLLISMGMMLMPFRRHRVPNEGDDPSVWKRAIEIARIIYKRESAVIVPYIAPSSVNSPQSELVVIAASISEGIELQGSTPVENEGSQSTTPV